MPSTTSPRPCPLCLGAGQVWADGIPSPELSIYWRHRCPVCIGERVAIREPPDPEFPDTLPPHPGLVSGVCAAGVIVV